MTDYSKQDLQWIGPGRYNQDEKSEQVESLIYRGECNLEQEIVDEFVRLRALETCPGRVCSRGCTKSCRAQCYRNDMAGYCSAILCLLIVACLLFLTFFAIFDIVPRVTSTLERTTGCTVVRFDYEDFDKTAEGECACHIRCLYTIDYCVQIVVEYTNDDGKRAVRTLDRSETSGQENTPYICTAVNFPQCPGDAYPDIYRNKMMTIGSTFLCLSHPYLLITDIFDVLSLIHTCWPVGIILISLIWLLCICCTCGCKYISVEDYPPDVKTIADGLGSKGIFTIVNLSEGDRTRIVREWKTVCVRIVSGEEGKPQRSGQKGASIPGEMHHHEAAPQVQVDQQPQVHQVQVCQQPQVHQVQMYQDIPPAYAPPAYEGMSHDQTSTGSASQSARFNEHVPQEEEAGKYVPENKVSHEEEEEEGEEKNEYLTLEDQPGEHFSQEQISEEDLSTEDTGLVSGPHDNVPSDHVNEESAELQMHREHEVERLMGQGQIDLPLEHVPGHDNSKSTRL